MKTVVRYCLILIILLSAKYSLAEEDFYLSSSEKAVIALALKSVNSETADQAQLVSKIFSRLRKSEVRTQVKIHVVNYKEFIEAQKNSDLFENSSNAQLDNNQLLAEIKSVDYYSNSKHVQKRIDNYYARRQQQIISSPILTELLNFDTALQSYSTNLSIKEYINKSIEEKTDQFIAKFGKSENPQTLLISQLLKKYFANLPRSQKIEIVYQLSLIPINSTSMDVFLVMIQNSGPQIQKLIQIMGRSPLIPAEFQGVFQKLESQVKPVPWPAVQELIESEGLKISDFDYFERKAIGVGTMAQTHRVQLRNENGERQSSVIRFLKPNIEQLLQMDQTILKTIAAEIDTDPELKKYNFPSLADLIDDLSQTVQEELSIDRTITDQTNGSKIYSTSEIIAFNKQKNKLQFSVPKTYSLGKNNKLMVQELVFGQKPYKELLQYKDIYPDLYRVIAEKTAELWLSEAFFKSGFFHADLHQGNIMMQLTDSEIKVNILDFGMTGQLTLDLQKSAILLGLGIKINNPALISKHFVLLSKNNKAPVNFEQLINEHSLEIKNLNLTTPTIAEWTAWALEHGLELNYEFLKLNRGLAAIEVLLLDAKSPLAFDDIIQNIMLKNKVYMADLLLKEKQLKLKNVPDMLTAIKPLTTKKYSCKSLF